jgi:ornithine decarboxylase
MTDAPNHFSTVDDLVADWRPGIPVYCIYPHVYRQTARSFLRGFPGRVLYAVKANDHPAVIRLLHEGGVRHFDCASVPEIERVKAQCPRATCYFMVPVLLRGAASEAARRYGVRHFMIDHPAGLRSLAQEIPLNGKVLFARMAVSHDAASMDLSSKFGAPAEDIPGLLERIIEAGAEPALAFNVGTLVTHPDAYRHAIETAARVLGQLDFKVRLVDLGGGFPRPYPGFSVPPLSEFFSAIRDSASQLPMMPGGELLAEPGRALSAPGLSAVVEVLMRKGNRLYLNDGMYGIFWELRFKAHTRFAVRVCGRPEGGCASPESFTLYGPTCDASDVLPAEVELPGDVKTGDYLEFGNLGAYSLAGRTAFNGHYSDRVVQITSSGQAPPGCEAGAD